MQAIGQFILGGPEVLQFIELAEPVLRPGDLLVQVRAFALNPVDAHRRRGGQPGSPVAHPPQIVGWDAAGVVTATGPQATHFKIGDEVYFAGDASRQGCYAEYVAVDERIVARKPRSFDFLQAAAVPLTALTAWEAFFENMDIPQPAEPGRTLLIVGGAGGVGSMAIQIAKKLAGLSVIATASRPESTEYCKKMGADAVIDHTRELAPQLRELGLDGVDYVLNTARLSDYSQLMRSAKPLGRICTITGDGDALKSLDFDDMFSRRLTLTFELMFTRSRLNYAPEKQGQILARMAELLDSRVLDSTLTTVIDWREIRQAHELLDSSHTLGKIAMQVSA